MEPDLFITVDVNDLTSVENHGSVVRVTGTNLDDPTQRVTFAGDARSMAGLLAIVEQEGEVTCGVESWQVLSTSAQEACS